MTSLTQHDPAHTNSLPGGAELNPLDEGAQAAAPTGANPAKGEGWTQTVRVEGLASTLGNIDHELGLLSHASKYGWINQRLILLRNASIAFGVVMIVVLLAVACYREAYRQTLTIAAFDVPEKLAERGISGQVIAKALFDELIKRRELVTTLETGELKGAWAESRADVAIPEAKFTLQSVFRYLRYMTGNETAIDGEVIVEGDEATMKVRVAGKPPTVVKGKLAQWDSMVGDLANGVLDVTQPAVLAAYMGINAQTPEDIKALSKHIVKMQGAATKPGAAVMSVAYDAYGSALQRQARIDEANAAFAEAMALDPKNGVAVTNAANAQSALRNYTEASRLYQRARELPLPAFVKAQSLGRRIAGATNTGDCLAAEQAVRELRASPDYSSASASPEAIYIAQCEFEEARAVALIERLATLHPDSRGPMNALGVILIHSRPENRYRDEGIRILRKAIANGVDDSFVYTNLALALATKGEYAESRQLFVRAEEIQRKAGIQIRSSDGFDSYLYYFKGDYANADAAFARVFAMVPRRDALREAPTISIFAEVQVGLTRFDEAAKVYQEGLARLPKNCFLWEGFGTMHVAKGDFAGALTTFDKGIAAVPKCGLNYNSAARLLIKQNRAVEARQKLEALIKIAPKSDGAVIAKEILAGLAPKP